MSENGKQQIIVDELEQALRQIVEQAGEWCSCQDIARAALKIEAARRADPSPAEVRRIEEAFAGRVKELMNVAYVSDEFRTRFEFMVAELGRTGE